MVMFEQAYEAAAGRYTDEQWTNLHPSAVVQAIFEAMRRLDAEAAALAKKAQDIPRQGTKLG
jgi:hypothetical protein